MRVSKAAIFFLLTLQSISASSDGLRKIRKGLKNPKALKVNISTKNPKSTKAPKKMKIPKNKGKSAIIATTAPRSSA